MTNHTDTSRSDDLVERLRRRNASHTLPDYLGALAADRIEALEAENERLTAILAELNDTDIVARTMADNAALEAKLAVAREALNEISRRTGLLIHQNTGRWKMDIEHDKRTVVVLTINQRIARAALKEIDNGDR